MDDHVELGDLVKDPITSYTGIITSRTVFLYGCVRCGVTGLTLDKEGKEQIITFDLAQLELIEKAKVGPRIQPNMVRPPGGPGRVEDQPKAVPAR